jgi:drug/metabolite transporter (DMT)-like permease
MIHRGTGIAYVMLPAASLFWSGNHVLGRAIAGHVPPIGIALIRWLIPALVLLVVAHRELRDDWPQIKANWKTLLWLGLTGAAIFGVLQYVGLQYTSALNVSLINSTVPALIVLFGALVFRDSTTPFQLLGILISGIGVALIVCRGEFAVLLGLQFNVGDLIILLNMIIFAIYAVSLRLRPPLHWKSFLAVLAIVSTIFTLPFFLWEMSNGVFFERSWLTLFAIFYVSTFAAFFAQAAWNLGVERIGANRSGPFLHLIPVYTALLGAFLLDETLAPFHVLGFAIILVGVWLASRKQTIAKPVAQNDVP